MSDAKQLFTIASLPGIRRDGTELDGDNYSDGQWCRFQRGRPKKIGGWVRATNQLSGPIRDVQVWSRQTLNAITSFSPYGIEQVLVDNNGLGASIAARTPSGWTTNSNAVWTTATQYDDAVSSQGTVILAHAASSLLNIDDTTATKPYLGLAAGDAAFTQIADAPAVSGGVFATAPFTVVYGSDGFVGWSDENLPQNWYTGAYNFGASGADRVTGAKVVKGLPLRSGSGPAGLLWSLDSVVRMDYSGGGSIFRFTHLTSQSSILSQRGVIEYDGAYFWMGVDRFLVCDGGQVRELPNQMNINWVYDNLNFAQRQKVWVTKVPRYGEIWWHFPYGDADECTHAVIYNVREQTWYDSSSTRSAGFFSQVFNYPVWSDSSATTTEQVLNLSSVVGTFSPGDSLLSGNGAQGVVIQISGAVLRVHVLGTTRFGPSALTDTTSAATAVIDSERPLYNMFIHERGRDSVDGDSVSAIESYFTTADFGLPTGGAQPNAPQGLNRWTRVMRVEPDFIQEGEMTMQVLGREFANLPETTSSGYNFTNETDRLDTREQARQVRLKFISNTVGGHYEMGRVLLHLQPGDVRS